MTAPAMYIPRPYAESRFDVLRAFMEAHPFAMLVSADDDLGVRVTHLPMTVTVDASGDVGLVGHLARANPHWRCFDGQRKATVVFHGPHAYVSPASYTTPDVPTWIYAVVHAHGAPSISHDAARLMPQLRALTAPYEAGAAQLVERFQDKVKRIVGIEIPVDRLEGKFKLDQDRPLDDQRRVAAALLGSERCSDRDCGALMLGRLQRAGKSA